MVLEETSWDHQSSSETLSENHEYLYKIYQILTCWWHYPIIIGNIFIYVFQIMAINPTAVKIDIYIVSLNGGARRRVMGSLKVSRLHPPGIMNVENLMAMLTCFILDQNGGLTDRSSSWVWLESWDSCGFNEPSWMREPSCMCDEIIPIVAI